MQHRVFIVIDLRPEDRGKEAVRESAVGWVIWAFVPSK